LLWRCKRRRIENENRFNKVKKKVIIITLVSFLVGLIFTAFQLYKIIVDGIDIKVGKIDYNSILINSSDHINLEVAIINNTPFKIKLTNLRVLVLDSNNTVIRQLKTDKNINIKRGTTIVPIGIPKHDIIQYLQSKKIHIVFRVFGIGHTYKIESLTSE